MKILYTIFFTTILLSNVALAGTGKWHRDELPEDKFVVRCSTQQDATMIFRFGSYRVERSDSPTMIPAATPHFVASVPGKRAAKISVIHKRGYTSQLIVEKLYPGIQTPLNTVDGASVKGSVAIKIINGAAWYLTLLDDTDASRSGFLVRDSDNFYTVSKTVKAAGKGDPVVGYAFKNRLGQTVASVQFGRNTTIRFAHLIEDEQHLLADACAALVVMNS